MEEICNNAENFLKEIIDDMGLDLEVTRSIVNDGCLLDLKGDDAPLTLAENAEMLDAFEVILFQMFGRGLDRSQRIICDADGFRQTRKAELQAMARFARDTVRKNGLAFTFGVLNSTERRIIHMHLQENEDLLTESVGQGRDRRLQVRLK